MNNEKDLAFRALHSVADALENDQDGVVTFINELLTEKERFIIARRILAAQMLISGNSHEQLMTRMSLSPNSTVRTRRWLREILPNYLTVLEEQKTSFGIRDNRGKLGLFFGGKKKEVEVQSHYLVKNIPKDAFPPK